MLTNSNWYVALHNSLWILSTKTPRLRTLESILVDPIEELDHWFDLGTCDDALKHFISSGILTEDLVQRLLELKQKVEKLPANLWSYKEMRSNSKWKEIANISKDIYNKAGFEENGIISGNMNILYK